VRPEGVTMDVQFEKHLPLVRSLVKRYRSGFSEGDDLFQVGCIGLLKAMKGFDPERGTAFATYAVPVIAGEIKMYLRGQGALKYSRALKVQAVRIKRLQDEMEQRLGRPPTLGELAEAGGFEREEVLVALDVMRTPLSLEAVQDGGQPGPSADGEAEEVIDRVALREALANLPPRERQIVLYRFFQHRTQQDVASMLGISQVHVSRLERKVLSELKTFLTV
jgi:RNA polymerase sporulation-specific sigma factor